MAKGVFEFDLCKDPGSKQAASRLDDGSLILSHSKSVLRHSVQVYKSRGTMDRCFCQCPFQCPSFTSIRLPKCSPFATSLPVPQLWFHVPFPPWQLIPKLSIFQLRDVAGQRPQRQSRSVTVEFGDNSTVAPQIPGWSSSTITPTASFYHGRRFHCK
jgi:hypothetical protein